MSEEEHQVQVTFESEPDLFVVPWPVFSRIDASVLVLAGNRSLACA
jgi:hypothetical protein